MYSASFSTFKKICFGLMLWIIPVQSFAQAQIDYFDDPVAFFSSLKEFLPGRKGPPPRPELFREHPPQAPDNFDPQQWFDELGPQDIDTIFDEEFHRPPPFAKGQDTRNFKGQGRRGFFGKPPQTPPRMRRGPRPPAHGEPGDFGVCIELHAPVCGKQDVQCVRAPCPGVYQTFGNKCKMNLQGFKFVHEGECEATRSPDPTSAPTEFEDEVVTQEDLRPFPFFDIEDTASLQAQAALYLWQNGIIGGFPDGTFRGDQPVNRAEAAKFLLLAQKIAVGNERNNGRFPDVKEGEWYVKYVLRAAKLGIIAGHEDGKFRPANSVNTAEFLKMMTKTFQLPENLPHNYADVEKDDWFAPYVGIAAKYNLFPHRTKVIKINDPSSHTKLLEPSRELTRYEVAVALYQYLRSQESGEGIPLPEEDAGTDLNPEEVSGNPGQSLHVDKNQALEHDIPVSPNETDVKALSVKLSTQNEPAVITSIKFRRIGNGNWWDFKTAWLEINNQLVSGEVELEDDIFEIALREPLELAANQAKAVVLKVSLSGHGQKGNSSRFVIFLPEWIESSLPPIGFFPFGGNDIEIGD